MRQNCLSRNAWLRDGARCAGLAMAGLLLAMAAVLVGTGWLDGFHDWGLHRIGRRLVRSLPWALPVGALAGVAIHGYFRAAIGGEGQGEAKGGLKALLVLLAVARAFALFPLLGFAILLAVIAGIVVAVPLAAIRQLSGKTLLDGSDSLSTRLMIVPLWAMTLPFTLLRMESEGDIEIPARVAARRLLAWLPFVLLLVVVWAGAESEATGERVDPYWLSGVSAYWLADYLIVAGWVAPTLAERARARRAAKWAASLRERGSEGSTR